MPSSEFSRIVKDLGQFGDTIAISCGKHGIKFSVAGDMGSGNVRLGQSATYDDEKHSVMVEIQEPVNLSFAAKYLSHFAKASPLAEQASFWKVLQVFLTFFEYSLRKYKSLIFDLATCR